MRARLLTAMFGLSLLTGPAVAGTAISAPQGHLSGPGTIMEQAKASLVCVSAFLSYQTGLAERVCGQLVEAMPDDAFGYKWRGLAYLLDRRYERAEADFRIAVRLDAKDPESHAGYGQSLAGQGRFAEADPQFAIALRIAPTDVRYLAAACWSKAGDGHHLDEAAALCSRALRRASDFGTAYENRALVRLKQKNWNAAIKDYSHALALDGDRAISHFGRGLAYLKLARAGNARKDIMAARAIDPQIEDSFILQNVLPPGCAGDGPCPLPRDLQRQQPQATVPRWGVAYHPRRDDMIAPPCLSAKRDVLSWRAAGRCSRSAPRGPGDRLEARLAR